MAWVWVADSVVYAIHEAQLAEGGITGIRDEGLLPLCFSLSPQS